MRNNLRRSTWSVLLAAVGIAAIAAAIAASASAKATKAKAAASTTTVDLLSGTGPQSLDPGLDYTTQGSEINWEVYTGLTTYKHAGGIASTELQPGLATALPKIIKRRQDLHGHAAQGPEVLQRRPRAGERLHLHGRAFAHDPVGWRVDVRHPVRRGRCSLCQPTRPRRISGISTNNATGKIVIHLTQPYGPFANVLAFPAFGFVDPKTAPTPFKVQASDPPAGAGPVHGEQHQHRQVVRHRSEPELGWRLPGIPKATVNVPRSRSTRTSTPTRCRF